MPLTTTYTAIASDALGRSSSNSVTVSIPNNNTSFLYDGNGNLIYDGLRSFAYDNENQLIWVCVTNQYFSQFTYDGKMRRRIRQEYTSQGGAWVQTNEVYYVYDGNEVIQERDLNNLPTTTYTRGKDLSGSLEGAGGIGGLLARTDNTSIPAVNSYYHSDANGNVTMLINSSNAIVAKYLYDAFGNILSKSGLLADANLYRFSSKEFHPNSGLVYYLYRYYDASLQRWPNRDPIEEDGGINLYEFVANSPISEWDFLGLQFTGGWPGRPPNFGCGFRGEPPDPPKQCPCTVDCKFAGFFNSHGKRIHGTYYGTSVLSWDCTDCLGRKTEENQRVFQKGATMWPKPKKAFYSYTIWVACDSIPATPPNPPP
jgi:RHS repeat-associated protein